MAKGPHKLTLSPSRDIPFDRLVLSQANVRRVKTGVSIPELADDIYRRTLLQSLNVRPMLDDAFSSLQKAEQAIVKCCLTDVKPSPSANSWNIANWGGLYGIALGRG